MDAVTAMHLAPTTPRAFALRNLDAAGKPVEPTRFRSATAAMMRGIELRTGARATTRGPKPVGRAGDGMVRDVVGLDAQGRAWTLKLGDLHVTRENPTGWVLDKLIDTTRAKRGETPARLRLVK